MAAKGCDTSICWISMSSKWRFMETSISTKDTISRWAQNKRWRVSGQHFTARIAGYGIGTHSGGKHIGKIKQSWPAQQLQCFQFAGHIQCPQTGHRQAAEQTAGTHQKEVLPAQELQLTHSAADQCLLRSQRRALPDGELRSHMPCDWHKRCTGTAHSHGSRQCGLLGGIQCTALVSLIPLWYS